MKNSCQTMKELTLDGNPIDITLINSRLFIATKYRKDKIYSGILIMNEKQEVLLNNHQIPPSIELADRNETGFGAIFEDFSVQSDEFTWAKTTSLDWEPYVPDVHSPSNPHSFVLSCLIEQFQDVVALTNASLKFRKRFYRACIGFHTFFYLRNFGYMSHKPVTLTPIGSYIILNVLYLNSEDLSQDTFKKSHFRWHSLSSLNTILYSSPDHSSIWTLPHVYYARQSYILKPGLYLGGFFCVATLKGISTFLRYLTQRCCLSEALSNLDPTDQDSRWNQHDKRGEYASF
jgi:hypothetical protein